MMLSGLHFCIPFLLMNTGYSMILREGQYAPRSVPGRIKSSADPFSLKDYFLSYLSSVRHHQQPQYGMPEYEPPYQNSFYKKHQITPEALATLLPYLSQLGAKDYSYDYNVSPTSGNDDQSWYEDSDSNNLNLGGDTSSQDAALMQLFLDHLQGKYSLEDLQTLEREAAIEDNNENQLQALMTAKKAQFPVQNVMPSLRRDPMPFRQGQKEEVIMQPAATVRRPVFTRSFTKQEKIKKSPKTPAGAGIKKNAMNKESTEIKQKNNNSDMEPMVKTAYDSLRRYLDRERMIRQAADEQEVTHTVHTAQKRFVSQPKALTEQLVNLKKTVL